MSQNSKAKRDKRKKQQAKRPFLRLNAQQQVQNHAVLTNEDGQVVAAIGLQGREWLLAIGGSIVVLLIYGLIVGGRKREV